jgi:hypothetical protein
MKDTLKIAGRVIGLFIILILVTRVFKKADERAVISPEVAFYTKGNAPDSVRMEVIEQLRKFQDGYTERDPGMIDTFMGSLYSKDNILILGTMPNEVYIGYDEARTLVKADWESWGDCRFEIDSAHISSSGNTAWFSTKGYVKFDLTRLLVLPLRLTGILVKEDQEWKFRQQQFQFDVDFSFSLVATLIISVWILVNLILLSVMLVKRARIIQLE